MDGETIPKEWEKEKIELEQDLFELQSQLDDARKNLSEYVRKNADLRQHLEKTESDRNERVRLLFDLESTRDSLESEKAQLKRSCDNLAADKSNLVKILDDRSEQIQRLQDEIRGLKNELKNLTLEKCHQQIKADDVASRELLLEHREKRWQQERELLNQEKEWYYNELSQRDQQIQHLRKESSAKILNIQAEFDTVQNENYRLETSITSLKEENDNLLNTGEEINKKLRQTMDAKTEMESMYEREILCQTKLVNIYKSSTEDAEKKVEELSKTLENVQGLFEEAKDSHIRMQEEIKLLNNDHTREINEKDKLIADLKDELEKANELLRSKHRVMLSDEEISTLSPGAAAASRLIKTGLTLTQVYREHMRVVEDLQEQKLENKRIEEHFCELVQDVATKAPILREQQEEYFKNLELLDNLKSQLDSVSRNLERQTLDKEASNRQLAYTKSELERCQRNNVDLSAQVRELIHIIETIRQNDYSSVAPRRLEGNDDTFLFRNIDELLTQNQRLKSALYEAEAKRDEMIKAAQDAEMSKMKNELQMALQELEDVKNFREKQDKLLQAVSEQRDSYEKLFHEKLLASKDSSTADQNAEAARPSQELNDMKLAYDKLNTEFEVYREQKTGIEKFFNDKLEKLQQDLTESRSINSKLNAEVQYHIERFKIAHNNIETYKNEIKSLRERNEKYSGAVARQEQRATDLTDELLKNCEELTKLKVENNRLQESLRQSTSHENRLDQELQMLRKNSFSQQMLSATLQDLQSRLERAEAEQTLKLKIDVENMTKERNNLQETVKNLNEKCEKYVNEHCSKVADFEAKLEDERKKSARLESQLNFAQEQMKKAEENISVLQNDLTSLRSSSEDTNVERYQKESQQLQTRLNYLEIRFTEANKKIEELTEKLSWSEKQLEQYRNLSNSLETGLEDQKKFVETERSRLQTQIAENEVEIKILRDENQNLNERLKTADEQLISERRRIEATRNELLPRIKLLENSLEEAKAELETWKVKERDLKLDLEREMAATAEYRSKFDHEFGKNKENESTIEALREKLESTTRNFLASEAKLNGIQSELDNHNKIVNNIEEKCKNERGSLQDRITMLINHNKILLENIEKLGNNLSVLEKVRSSVTASSETGFNTSNVEEMQEKSCDSLMQVITCLRDERQRTVEKLDQAETELLRLKSRESLLQNDINRLNVDLEAARKEAATLPEIIMQKAQLLAKLDHLSSTQETNKMLNDEKMALEGRISKLEAHINEMNDRISQMARDKQNLEHNLEEARKNFEFAQSENAEWQRKYAELIEARAKFEEEEVYKLRTELSGTMQKLTTCSLKNESLTSENSSIKTNLETLQEEKDLLSSKLLDLTSNYETVKTDSEENKKKLERVRLLAIKYKMEFESLTESKKKKDEEIEGLKKQLEMAGGEKASIEELAKCEKDIADLKAQLTENEKTLNENGNDKRQLEEKITELQEQKKTVEQNFEEQRFRLDLITNQFNKLNDQYKNLNDQYKNLLEQCSIDKANREKALGLDSGAKVVMSKPAPIQAVPAMPSISTDRPGSSGMIQETGRPRMAPGLRGRGMLYPTASVRPMATVKTTVAVPPTAISPSPAVPDQSSSGASGFPLQTQTQTASNVVSTSTANQQSASVAVPQAVVFPNLEFQPLSESDVTESGDAEPQGATISSSGVSMQSSTASEVAGTGFQAEPPSTSSKRRHSFLETIDVSSKRSRAPSPEQVSTSDQSTSSAMIVPVLVAPQNEDSGLEEPTEMVGSSLDDEVVIVEEREVESSGQEATYGEGTSSAAARSLGSGDARQLPQGWPASTLGALRGEELGDDGIVPSTPTLHTTRNYMESEITAAHVPQGRPGQFTFASQANVESFSFIQSHAYGEPAVPTTPRGTSPHDLGVFVSENEAASSSTTANLFDQESTSASTVPVDLMQQPQPSGQGEEVDVDVEISTGEIIEGTEMSSEAVAASHEESSSRRRRIPITWSEVDSPGPSSSDQPPASPPPLVTPRGTTRGRGLGARGRGSTGRARRSRSAKLRRC